MINNLKLLLAFTAVIIFIAGCGKTEQKQDQKTDTKTDGSQQQQTTENKTSGDQTTKTDGKNELGIKDGMPADYPADVPKPLNGAALGFLNTQEGVRL